MRRVYPVIGTCVAAGIAVAMALAPAPEPADLILHNGAIYTVDAARSWAEALAISGGRLVYVGTDAGVSAYRGPDTHTIDLKGRLVLPGFHDSHVHPATGGLELGLCDLNGLDTKASILETIKRYAQTHPDRPWIEGGGWDLPLFPDANPLKAWLDELVPDRPVYLSAADGHSAWVNSKALEVAGITAETPDPPSGRIERQAGSREPSGTLRESAMDLVSRHIPPPSREDWLLGLQRGLSMANRFGIVSLQEASASAEMLAVYSQLDAQQRLTARVVAAQRIDPARGPEQIAELEQRRQTHRSAHLKASAAKIFVDGVIEAHTAALLQPYLDQAGSQGHLNLPVESLQQLVTELDGKGFQVHLHAIGDRAVRASLDACEAALRRNGNRDRRHHIAHLELIDPADIPRFQSLGVIANFQPLWAYADTYIVQLTEPVLGPERSRWLYPLASVYRTGAVVAGGSDWSVSSMNPLDAIQVALTRRGLKNAAGPSWIPQELMSLPEMIAAYTINGAFVNHEEDDSGSLETGKWADLIVLDRNLFQLPPAQIHEARVLLTLLEGQPVYRDPAFSWE